MQQCILASRQFEQTLKRHSGEKSNKCSKMLKWQNMFIATSGTKLQVVTIEVGYTCRCSLSILIRRLVNVVVIGV